MNLRGTKTENDLREQLIKSSQVLTQDANKKRLLNEIQTYFEIVRSVYVLNWIPEQGEDIYTILINGSDIVIIEVDKFDLVAKPIINKITIDKYRDGLSKLKQIQLVIAIDLAKNNLG